MMNFNVKYHFSHALMHCLRREGGTWRGAGKGQDNLAWKKNPKPFSSLSLYSVWAVLCTVTLTHPADSQPYKHTPKCSLTFHNSQESLTALHIEQVWHWQTYLQLPALFWWFKFSSFIQMLLCPSHPSAAHLPPCPSFLPSCLSPPKSLSDLLFLPNSGSFFCESAWMSGNLRKKVVILGVLLFYFQICSQLDSQGSMNSQGKKNLSNIVLKKWKVFISTVA